MLTYKPTGGDHDFNKVAAVATAAAAAVACFKNGDEDVDGHRNNDVSDYGIRTYAP